jgi:hypothetical protein
MKYRVAMLCCGSVTGYWCGGSTHWTTDPSRAERFPDRAGAEAQVNETARWITRNNLVIEEEK